MIQNLVAIPLGSSSFQLSWTSTLTGLQTFRIYRDGVFVTQTALYSYTVTATDGQYPVFEVLDGTDQPEPGFPSYLTLTWSATPATSSYRIEQLIGAAWTPQVSITDHGPDTPRYFTWSSPALPDDATYSFRIVPFGTNGNDGTPVVQTSLLVRIPDVPQVNYTYDPTPKTVTIAPQ